MSRALACIWEHVWRMERSAGPSLVLELAPATGAVSLPSSFSDLRPGQTRSHALSLGTFHSPQ